MNARTKDILEMLSWIVGAAVAYEVGAWMVRMDPANPANANIPMEIAYGALGLAAMAGLLLLAATPVWVAWAVYRRRRWVAWAAAGVPACAIDWSCIPRSSLVAMAPHWGIALKDPASGPRVRKSWIRWERTTNAQDMLRLLEVLYRIFPYAVNAHDIEQLAGA